MGMLFHVRSDIGCRIPVEGRMPWLLLLFPVPFEVQIETQRDVVSIRGHVELVEVDLPNQQPPSSQTKVLEPWETRS